MNVGGFANTLRRGLAIALAALALAVAVLWADSYRSRWTEPLTAEQEVLIEFFMAKSDGLRMYPRPIGLDCSHQLDKHKWFRIRTHKGELSFLSEAGILTRKPVASPVELSWGGFGYEQWTSREGSMGGDDGRPALNADFRTSIVTMPLWAIWLGLAIYPVVFVIRGPFRQRRRRKRGQCLACGYDLSQSPDRCPECGTARDRPRSSTAGDR